MSKKLNLRFLQFTTFRYFKRSVSIFSIVGIAVGVMALIAVISVMDGFQSGFIESILDVDSYHIRVNNVKVNSEIVSTVKEIMGIPGVVSVIPFTENKAIASSDFSQSRGVIVRGLPVDVCKRDMSFKRRVKMIRGNFDISSLQSIVIGVELADMLNVGVGGSIVLVSLSGSGKAGLVPVKKRYTISGIFKTGYYDIDLNWCFISLKAANIFFQAGGDERLTLGIKIKNRFDDRRVVEKIRGIKSIETKDVVSWRVYNHAFFNALLMEKVMMYLLLSLIFVVVGFNIYHSMRRLVYEKVEDIAILRTFGAFPASIQRIFVLEGLFIGIVGSFLGVLVGFFISININEVFSFLEWVINFFLEIVNLLLSIFNGGFTGANFSIFSPVYFYLMKVPVKIYFLESLSVVMFAVLSSLTAAFFASRDINKIKPAVILRNQ